MGQSEVGKRSVHCSDCGLLAKSRLGSTRNEYHDLGDPAGYSRVTVMEDTVPLASLHHAVGSGEN